jgi:hypothetical protein
VKLINTFFLAAALTALGGCATGKQAERGTWEPSATIIGDSISDGYLSVVAQKLTGEFKVAHACSTLGGASDPCNDGQTVSIIKEMPDYFKSGDADVVTFNSGIHDIFCPLAALQAPSQSSRTQEVRSGCSVARA